MNVFTIASALAVVCLTKVGTTNYCGKYELPGYSPYFQSPTPRSSRPVLPYAAPNEFSPELLRLLTLTTQSMSPGVAQLSSAQNSGPGPTATTTLSIPAPAPQIIAPGRPAPGPLIVQLPPKCAKTPPVVVPADAAPNLVVKFNRCPPPSPIILPTSALGPIIINDENVIEKPCVTTAPAPESPKIYFELPPASAPASPVALPPAPLPSVFYNPARCSCQKPDIVQQAPVGLPKLFLIPSPCPCRPASCLHPSPVQLPPILAKVPCCC